VWSWLEIITLFYAVIKDVLLLSVSIDPGAD
jgi:hypothetical protein